MEIITLRLSQLKPYEKNAKKHPRKQIDQIRESIRRFGMNDPIGIWGDDNLIIEGHGRYMALKELCIEEAPCIRLDHLTDDERKEYTLIHNKTTMNSDFDEDILAEELKDILESDPTIDMSNFGFPVFEIEDEIAKSDDFEESPFKETGISHGDVFRLGDHILMCGDSTSQEDVDKLMGGIKADLLQTDPPYNVNVSNSDGMTIENDNMEKGEFQRFIDKAMECASSHLKAGGGILYLVW